MSVRWDRLRLTVERRLKLAKTRASHAVIKADVELQNVLDLMKQLDEVCDRCGFPPPKDDPRGCQCENDE